MADLERAILDLLDERAPKTICPSDVARRIGPADGWRDLMDPVRAAARRLVAAGEVEITQRGEVVDLATVKGPIRIRRPLGR
ncbi:DUF3253 domain-containing protein [Nocardioides flavescens]|uniref:DUF3253 domain-containing protein n=1 Tax=Nocardioides flavescens TaxID=2691959 RepID=UPI00301CE43B